MLLYDAERIRLFRIRKEAVEELQNHVGLPDELDYLWNTVIAFENYPFETAGKARITQVRQSSDIR